MDRELRLAFWTRQKSRLSAGEVISLLHAIGLKCSAGEQQVIVEAYEESELVGFSCEEFLELSESLGYSERAHEQVSKALGSIAEPKNDDRIDLTHLKSLIRVAGSRIDLTAFEVEEFLRFQLGAKALTKPQISMKAAKLLLY